MLRNLQLFFVFAKIGMFTLGGGYAMLPLIEREIVSRKGWIDEPEFVDLVAIAQSSPGILAVNVAIFVGNKIGGILGCISSVLGAVLPSFLMIVLIASFFHDYQSNVFVSRIFKGVRPAVVALIAVPVFTLAKSAKINRKTIFITLLVVALVGYLKLSPAYIILFLILCGIFCVGKGYIK